MKNQYIADIGDYGKYGLLRFIDAHGIKLGINWYLTDDDGSNDGKHITYLKNEKERIYDETLFDYLKGIVDSSNKSVQMIEKSSIFNNAKFYNDVLHSVSIPTYQRDVFRGNWHKKAVDSLKDCDLVFLDPDIGMIGKKGVTDADSEQYVIPKEVADYYRRGQNVVYYCHKGRRSSGQWEKAKALMLDYLPEAKVCVVTFHRGTQQSYIFVLHPECYGKYRTIITDFLNTKWSKLFTEEPVEGII